MSAVLKPFNKKFLKDQKESKKFISKLKKAECDNEKRENNALIEEIEATIDDHNGSLD